jgi:hypothetical protein
MKFHIGLTDPQEWSYDGRSHPYHLNSPLGQRTTIESVVASSETAFRYESLFLQLGWTAFVRSKRSPCDFHGNLLSLPHPGASLLASFQQDGVPVKLAREQSRAEVEAAVERGSHHSAKQHLDFTSMQEKGQWLTLPYRVAKDLPSQQ